MEKLKQANRKLDNEQYVLYVHVRCVLVRMHTWLHLCVLSR